MYWHVILTEKCNSNCKYCYEKSMKEFDNSLQNTFEFDFTSPVDFNVEINSLKNFIIKDKNPVIIFYGGEPLLKIGKIKEIMDNINAKFCMQTNGKLLNLLDKNYLLKFSRILVSLDGNEKRTDANRGKGTYKKVLENLKALREKGFKGEVVARMTLSFPDVLNQVKHIIKLLNKGLFDSIHWQLDAGFYKNDFSESFSNFVEEYNKQITKLIALWLYEMKKGKVLKFYPFLGIFESLYYNTKTQLRCGAGCEGYAITTDGKITACPITNNIKNFYCGDLNSPIESLKKINVTSPCKECEILHICGGRCLYSNYAKLWPPEGQELICKTIKHLIKEMRRALPEIQNLLSKGAVKEQDFAYEKYFGPEIIP